MKERCKSQGGISLTKTYERSIFKKLEFFVCTGMRLENLIGILKPKKTLYWEQ